MLDRDGAAVVEGLAQQLAREFRGLRAWVDLHPPQDFEDAYLWLEFEGADEDEYRDAFNFARAGVETLWRERDIHVSIRHRRQGADGGAEPEAEEGKHWD